MAIILKKLKFSNMYSYGSNVFIDLNKEKITQLAAPNGSGKSSIAFILQEILFNKNIKGIKKGDILNKYSKAKTWDATLYFSINDREYSLEVVRTTTQTKVVLIEDGIDISEHKVLDTYKKLQDLLGMTFEIFSQLSYQSSTDLLEFLKATDTNRKKFLINLFGFEKYIDIGESIKKVSQDVEKSLQEKRGELRSVDSYLESTILKDKKEFIDIPLVDNSLLDKSISLEAALQNLEKDSKLIDKNNLYLKERSELVFDIGLEEPLNPQLEIKIQQLRDTANQHKRIVEETKSKLKELDLRDSCYACGQSLDISQSLAQKQKLEQTIADSTLEYHKIKNLYNELVQLQQEYINSVLEYQNNRKKIERFETLSNLIDTNLPKEVPNKNNIVLELKNTKEQLNLQTINKTNAEKYNEEVRLHNTRIDMLTEEKEKFFIRQKALRSDIVDIQNQANNLQILKKAFSASGIVAFKLENVAKDLEQTINKYLTILSDGQFSVVFRLTGEKLNVIVINNGQEATIESLSGGEFSRVQTSVLLAVRSTLSKIGGNSLNLLFLDEITGVLDESGKEKLFEILSEETGLNVFLISHDYSHPLIPRMEIIKSNNISRISY